MKAMIGYRQALDLVTTRSVPLPAGTQAVENAVGRVAAEDLFAAVDSPSADVSLKDGFAVRAESVCLPRPGSTGRRSTRCRASR
ncbi:MAG: hypothetical protein K9K88_02320 [Desulfobacterales bacterium]|nr:hypothetical protein [Desulfobacterales bacterium]